MASNSFFDWVISAARFAKGTKVRAEAVNAALDSVTAGFDLLPTDTQLNRGTRNYIASDTGAADAYAGSLSHVTAYGDGQEVDILIANTNLTATPTLDVSGVGATIIKTPGANTVPIGALAQNSIARLKYNATLAHWELIGVYDITSTVSAFMATMLDDTTAAAARATLGLNDNPLATVQTVVTGLTLTSPEADHLTGHNVGAMIAGDMLIVNYRISGTKGGTAGDLTSVLTPDAGSTGTLSHVGLTIAYLENDTIAASGLVNRSGTMIMRCNASGTPILKVYGGSTGSDITVATIRLETKIIRLLGDGYGA